MKKAIAIASMVAMLAGVAGCTTTQQSATVGGLAGAAIGGAASGSVGGAVAGGLIGGLAGAMVGQAAERGQCVYVNPWGYRYYAPCR